MSRIKRGLGKGLEKIFEDKNEEIKIEELELIDKSEKIYQVELDRIIPNPYQPRKFFDSKKINELANSIEKEGLLSPIIVRPKNDLYEIVAGERRFQATKKTNQTKISVIIRDYTEQQMAEIAILENIQRENLSSIEEAQSYKNLMELFNLKQEEVAKRLNKSRAHVANYIRLLSLDSYVQEMLGKNEISVGHARTLITLNTNKQIEITKQIIDKKLNVRDVEKILNKSKKTKKSTTNDISEYENELQNNFDHIIKIKGTQNKGKIEIVYKNKNELIQIIEKIIYKENK